MFMKIAANAITQQQADDKQFMQLSLPVPTCNVPVLGLKNN